MAADRSIEAAFYLGTLLKVSPRIQTPEAVHGAYYALPAAQGTSAIRAEADRAAVDEAISQIQTSARSHADDLKRSGAEADRLVAKLTADTQKFALNCDKAISDAKAKFENLTKAMEAKVALKASIEYLSDRKLACGQAAQSALKVFVGTAFVSLVLLAGVMRLQFGGSSNPSSISGNRTLTNSATNAPTSWDQNLREFILGAPNGGTPQAAPYLLILSLAALEFWVLKVLAKRWIGNLHASADADERVTMLKTYHQARTVSLSRR